jgi:hypothetical protein
VRGPLTLVLRPAAEEAVGRLPRRHVKMTTVGGRRSRAAHLAAQRRLQIALGVIWLADGALQLQPFMFGRGFVTHVIAPNAVGQPGFVAGPVRFAAHLIEPRVALFNAFAAMIQLLIGLGLIYRRTVKVALLTSFAWALGVWWIGEGLGGLFTGEASPLTGAPGPALLYVLIGLVVWPQADPKTGRAATRDVLRDRVVRGVWAALWLGFAALWLLPDNRASNATHDAIATAPSGANWLSTIHTSAATAATGHGLLIAIVAASLSAAIALGVLFDRWTKPMLALSVAIALSYFVVGQGMGGILTGSGTDPGSGPLLILLAVSLFLFERPNRPRAVDAHCRPAPMRGTRGYGASRSVS